MKYLLSILCLFSFMFSNPNGWYDDPSGGSPMPIILIIIGVIVLFIWLKSEL